MNNPIETIKNLIASGKNPKEVVMQLVGNTNNPVFNNLIEMAKKGDYNSIENFARNVFKEQGRDFDGELKKVQSLFNSFK